MTQAEIDIKKIRLTHERNKHLNAICEIDKKLRELSIKARSLDDPHALIPKQYKSLEDWMDGHPFPYTIESMIFKNEDMAFESQLSCNVYQEHYHIVRCRKKRDAGKCLK